METGQHSRGSYRNFDESHASLNQYIATSLTYVVNTTNHNSERWSANMYNPISTMRVPELLPTTLRYFPLYPPRGNRDELRQKCVVSSDVHLRLMPLGENAKT